MCRGARKVAAVQATKLRRRAALGRGLHSMGPPKGLVWGSMAVRVCETMSPGVSGRPSAMPITMRRRVHGPNASDAPDCHPEAMLSTRLPLWKAVPICPLQQPGELLCSAGMPDPCCPSRRRPDDETLDSIITRSTIAITLHVSSAGRGLERKSFPIPTTCSWNTFPLHRVPRGDPTAQHSMLVPEVRPLYSTSLLSRDLLCLEAGQTFRPCMQVKRSLGTPRTGAWFLRVGAHLLDHLLERTAPLDLCNSARAEA
jgi:hypothetical protein